ncbi:hypothetical protein PoB_000619900 [Plakobranchus ocellatus]|uniref:Uncharacterized protein n=1 Tax=Plakobranchus ocellatus TaxID=259542 RepID=A0AAV3Y9Q5_9GAST|nr:hypothetical protein PoB_000619900 [Plakobranchus ocellatus]
MIRKKLNPTPNSPSSSLDLCDRKSHDYDIGVRTVSCYACVECFVVSLDRRSTSAEVSPNATVNAINVVLCLLVNDLLHGRPCGDFLSYFQSED